MKKKIKKILKKKLKKIIKKRVKRIIKRYSYVTSKRLRKTMESFQ